MSQVKQVTVGSATYNVAQASAIQQKKLLLLIGAKVAYNSAATNTKEIDHNLLFGALLALNESTFDEIANIVLCKTVKSGGETLVTVSDFQGNMVEYFQLIVEAIKVNLQDFFTYLDKSNAESRKATRPVTA